MARRALIESVQAFQVDAMHQDGAPFLRGVPRQKPLYAGPGPAVVAPIINQEKADPYGDLDGESFELVCQVLERSSCFLLDIDQLQTTLREGPNASCRRRAPRATASRKSASHAGVVVTVRSICQHPGYTQTGLRSGGRVATPIERRTGQVVLLGAV